MRDDRVCAFYLRLSHSVHADEHPRIIVNAFVRALLFKRVYARVYLHTVYVYRLVVKLKIGRKMQSVGEKCMRVINAAVGYFIARKIVSA